MKIIILAGGSGSRLWPLSREKYPKQFIKLSNTGSSLFQETFNRSMLITNLDDIYVVTNQNYKFLVMGEVEELGVTYSEENILIEPEAKNTLPAIYSAINEINKKGEDTVVVFSSDHIILKNEEFVNIIKESEELSKKFVITFGIKPNSPHTGYGYISSGEQILNGFKVTAFKEKPDLNTAKEYIEKGYFWNAGIFMFNSEIFKNEVKSYETEIYDAFKSSSSIKEAFSKITRNISVDYGIMEKSNIVAVVPLDIGWNDLGSFDSFFEVYETDENGNITNEENILIDSKNNLIKADKDKIITTVGIDDLIVIDKKDVLLICKKDSSQKVRNIVDTLKQRKDPRINNSLEDYRPWGHYKILDEEKNSFKIKRITVNPGKKLSYQLHYHRSEHWIVVKGTAQVTVDDEVNIVCSGESIFFKEGQKHRLENNGKIPLEIIEVQMGQYLEEDDIIRFDDEYGRS